VKQEGDEMLKTLNVVVVGVAVVIAASPWLHAQSGAAALQGAWTVQSVSFPKPPVPPLNKPVGLIVFSGRHYAFSGADSSRPDLPQGVTADKATADQLRATWGSVVTEAGTFNVTGNTLKFTRMVSKGPAAMAPGNFVEETFTLNGDTLVVTQVRNQAGPIANPPTIRLTRAK
jgi:hypothetical protein